MKPGTTPQIIHSENPLWIINCGERPHSLRLFSLNNGHGGAANMLAIRK
jgi:hypothetical protein